MSHIGGYDRLARLLQPSLHVCHFRLTAALRHRGALTATDDVDRILALQALEDLLKGLLSTDDQLLDLRSWAGAPRGGAGLTRPGGPVRADRLLLHLQLQTPEIPRDVRRLANANYHFPVAEFLFQLAAYLSYVARDDDLAMIDLLVDAALLDEHRDGIRHELTGGPRRENRLALRIHHQEPRGHLARLHFAREGEVGEGEVGGDEQRAVRLRVVDRVDALIHLHRTLRVGVDVLRKDQKRHDLRRIDRVDHDDARVLGHEDARIDRLQQRIVRHAAGEGDGGEAEGTELLLDGRPPDVGLIPQSVLQ